MFCGKCGSKINDGKKFCPSCGTSVGQDESVYLSQETDKKSRKGKRGRIFVVVIILVGILLGFIIKEINKTTEDVNGKVVGQDALENSEVVNEEQYKKPVIKRMETYNEDIEYWTKTDYDVYGNPIKYEGSDNCTYYITIEYKYSNGNELLMSVTKEYDNDNNLQMEEKSIYSYEYNENNMPILQTAQVYDSNGIIIRKEEHHFEYDNSGNKSKLHSITYSADGEIEGESYSEWNSKRESWCCYYQIEYYSSGLIESKVVREFDKYGEIVRINHVNKGIEYEFMYENVYDKQGNILEVYKIVEENGINEKNLLQKYVYEHDDNGNIKKVSTYASLESDELELFATKYYSYYE